VSHPARVVLLAAAAILLATPAPGFAEDLVTSRTIRPVGWSADGETFAYETSVRGLRDAETVEPRSFAYSLLQLRGPGPDAEAYRWGVPTGDPMPAWEAAGSAAEARLRVDAIRVVAATPDPVSQRGLHAAWLQREVHFDARCGGDPCRACGVEGTVWLLDPGQQRAATLAAGDASLNASLPDAATCAAVSTRFFWAPDASRLAAVVTEQRGDATFETLAIYRVETAAWAPVVAPPRSIDGDARRAALTAAIAALRTTEDRAATLLAAAVAALFAGDWSSAGDYLQLARQAGSHDVDGPALLLATLTGNDTRSRRGRAAPDDWATLAAQVRGAASASSFDEAANVCFFDAQACQTLLRPFIEDPRARELAALVALERGDLDAADRALAAEPADRLAAVSTLRARLLLLRGQASEAESMAFDTLRDAPGSCGQVELLAAAAARRGAWSRAVPLAAAAAACSPNAALALRTWASAAWQERRFDVAVTAARSWLLVSGDRRGDPRRTAERAEMRSIVDRGTSTPLVLWQWRCGANGSADVACAFRLANPGGSATSPATLRLTSPSGSTVAEFTIPSIPPDGVELVEATLTGALDTAGFAAALYADDTGRPRLRVDLTPTPAAVDELRQP
jgi:hypothetical protein